jgi:hypothetical protein
LRTDDIKRFRVVSGVGLPPPQAGPPIKWGFLPLTQISVGDIVELPLDPDEAKRKVNAVRSYAGRMARKTNKKFSVQLTEIGIGIWRVQ